MKLMHVLAGDLPFLAMNFFVELARVPYSFNDKADGIIFQQGQDAGAIP